jgi:hypothetical protein
MTWPLESSHAGLSNGTISFKIVKTNDMTIHWKALEEHFLMVPLVLRLSKPTDMTIHWKALEEHFLMVPLVWEQS